MTPDGPSRRSAARWSFDAPAESPLIDVLIPTAGRRGELAVTLAGLAAQDDPPFRVLISDQSDSGAAQTEPSVVAMTRLLAAQGREVQVLPHLPRRGMAEQRQFLFDQSRAPAVLFLDDDIWLEPGALMQLHSALRKLACGFVGFAPQGLSYLGDDRPHQREPFEAWEGSVSPERVRASSASFARWTLHNAANLVHLAAERGAPDEGWEAYRVAWIAGCVLYDRQSLADCGAFEFWRDAPASHAGEDVAAEWRVMERFGGAGLLPSRAVHLEAPTTIPDRPVDLFELIFAEGDPAPAAGAAS